MGYIFLPESARLKSFASSSKGARGTVQIEIEFSDLNDLGYLLSNLVEMDTCQKRAVRAPVVKASAAKKPEQLALPAPRLALPSPRSSE